MKSQIKIRVTPQQSSLLRATAGIHEVPVAELVRRVLLDAVEHQVGLPPLDDVPAFRTADHSVRLDLSPDQIRAIRGIRHNLKFAHWLSLLVTYYLAQGKVQALFPDSPCAQRV